MPICVGQVCIDVLIVGRLDVDGQSFAPIGLRKTDAASDRLLIKCNCNFSIYRKEDVLFQLKIRGASKKFKNQPRPLLRPSSVSFCQHFRNLSRKTDPLN
jgi:hypothetical protein